MASQWGRVAALIAALIVAFIGALSPTTVLRAQTTDTAVVQSNWVRTSYDNGVKHGGVGVGVGLARRGAERAIVVELLAIRPIRLDRASSLRITTQDAISIELAPAADAWGVASSVGAKIKGLTAYTSRAAYPITLAQLEQLRAAEKVTLETIHGGGAASVRLRGAETNALWEYAGTP
jgi:hypothetical protein